MQGPTVQLRQLARHLRDMRMKAGISQKNAAVHIDCTAGKMTHLERARYAPKKTELESLCRLYGAENKLETLENLRVGANEKGWWSTFDLTESFDAFLGLEDGANSIKVTTLEVIPGLLQTETYARRIIESGVPKLTKNEVETQVDIRIQRQKRLTGDTEHPLDFSTVLSEGALRRRQPDAEQLQHLMNLQELPNVDIRVLPFDTDTTTTVDGTFTHLSFSEDTLRSVVYQESYEAGHIIDDETVVGVFEEVFKNLQNEALSLTESRMFIYNMMGTK